MTKQILLTQDQVALVDDWRFKELNQWVWQAAWNKPTQSFYAVRTERKGGRKKTVRMHRQVMNTPRGMDCDHKNHNTLDNQEHNLRNVTRSQNGMNKPLQSKNKLGEKNIYPHGSGYMVAIRKDRKDVFNKTFRTLAEAIAARDVALRKFHGEFAYRGES